MEEPGEQEVNEADVDEKEEVHFEQPDLIIWQHIVLSNYHHGIIVPGEQEVKEAKVHFEQPDMVKVIWPTDYHLLIWESRRSEGQINQNINIKSSKHHHIMIII